MTTVKGYVKYFGRHIPVTWERETKKYVYNVSKVVKENGRWVKNKRLFDEKMAKHEVSFIEKEA